MESTQSSALISSSTPLHNPGMVSYQYLGFEDFLEPSSSLETGIDLSKTLNNTVVSCSEPQNLNIPVQLQPMQLTCDNVGQTVQNVDKANLEPLPSEKKKTTKRSLASKRSICPHCGKSISAGAEKLAQHIRTHTGERPFLCSECGASFISKSALRTHTRLHTGEKPYMCGLCGKKFSQSSHLPIHLRIHTGEKPFQCTKCKRQFNTRYAYKNHVKIHKGILPFKCSICRRGFVCKSWLNDHYKVHSNEKPYECDICGKKFKDKSYVEKHKLKYCGNEGYKKRWKTPDVKKPKGRPRKKGKRKISTDGTAKRRVGRPKGRTLSKYKAKRRAQIIKEMAENEEANAAKKADSIPVSIAETSPTDEVNKSKENIITHDQNQVISDSVRYSNLSHLTSKPIYLGNGSSSIYWSTDPNDKTNPKYDSINRCAYNTYEKQPSYLKNENYKSPKSQSNKLEKCSFTYQPSSFNDDNIPLYLGNDTPLNCSEIPVQMTSQINHSSQLGQNQFKHTDHDNFSLDIELSGGNSIVNLAQPENLSLHSFPQTQNIDLHSNQMFSSFHQRSSQNLNYSQHNGMESRYSHYQNLGFSQQSNSGQNLSLRRNNEPQNLSLAVSNEFCSILSQPQNLSLHQSIPHNNLEQADIVSQSNILNLTTIQPENLSLPQNLTVPQNLTEPQNLSQPQKLSQRESIPLNDSLPPIDFSQTQDVLQPQNLSRSMNLIQPYNLSLTHNLTQPQNLSLASQAISHHSNNDSCYNSQPQNLSIETPGTLDNSKNPQPQNLSFDSVERSLMSLPQSFSEPQNLSVSHVSQGHHDNTGNFAQPQNLSLSNISLSFSDQLNSMSGQGQPMHMVYYP